MWKTEIKLLQAGQVQRFSILSQDQRLLYSDVIGLWQHDADFRDFFVALLANASFSAYFWETPPVALATVDQDFEFVLVDSPQLAHVTPDPHAFHSYFQSAHGHDGVVTFPNLGKDACLVVPCPMGPASAYSHIATFTRSAPDCQQHALWKRVGGTLARRLGKQPIWLSTAGLGVDWLHIRLDSIPKYYSYTPYKSSM